jgi:hypothetical protein
MTSYFPHFDPVSFLFSPPKGCSFVLPKKIPCKRTDLAYHLTIVHGMQQGWSCRRATAAIVEAVFKETGDDGANFQRLYRNHLKSKWWYEACADALARNERLRETLRRWREEEELVISSLSAKSSM